MNTTLPECMAPDGAEPCAAFAELLSIIEKYRSSVRAVALFNGIGWQVMLGRETIGNWATGTAELTAEHAAKRYAARVNAELDGGVRAFGCDNEARGLKLCLSWCGADQCPFTSVSSANNEASP